MVLNKQGDGVAGVSSASGFGSPVGRQPVMIALCLGGRYLKLELGAWGHHQASPPLQKGRERTLRSRKDFNLELAAGLNAGHV
jgi:hypothetical protein